MKPANIIKSGCVAYHIFGGIIDDKMVLVPIGGYKGKRCQELIDDGWSFVCRTPEYKVGQKTRRKPWPTSYRVAARRSHNNEKPQCLCDTCNMINCKIQRDWGIKAIKCDKYAEA